jgi:hypothetical protein
MNGDSAEVFSTKLRLSSSRFPNMFHYNKLWSMLRKRLVLPTAVACLWHGHGKRDIRKKKKSRETMRVPVSDAKAIENDGSGH